MYEELYFSYPDELNDPLDLGAELIVTSGADFVFEYFISAAIKATNIPRSDKLSRKEIEFSKKVAIKYSANTLNIDVLFTPENKDWLKNEYHKADLDPYNYDYFYTCLLNILSNLFPDNLQSVSFSSDHLNPLLWSIYGDKHAGFCMIFSPENNEIRLKKYMESEYKNFSVQSVKYGSDVSVDLSLMFNDEKEFDYDSLFYQYFPALSEKALLTKNSNWFKESELRVHLGVNTSFSHREKAAAKMTPVEKTYNYDVAQLVGIIFGFKMPPEDRAKVQKIFELKKQDHHFFEAIPQGNEMVVGYLGGAGFYD